MALELPLIAGRPSTIFLAGYYCKCCGPCSLISYFGSQVAMKKLKRYGGGPSPPPKKQFAKRNYIDQVSTYEMKKRANATRHSRLVLHVAAQVGNEQVAAKLIQGGLPVDARDVMGDTPLHHTAKKDNFGVSRALITSKANVSIMNNEGLTPLHVACSHGSIKVAELLLQSSVHVDCDSAHGETPLHTAARGGQTAVVKLLLEAKASLFRPNANGESPLDVARSEAKKRMTLVACTQYGKQPDVLPSLRAMTGHASSQSYAPTPPTPPLPHVWDSTDETDSATKLSSPSTSSPSSSSSSPRPVASVMFTNESHPSKSMRENSSRLALTAASAASKPPSSPLLPSHTSSRSISLKRTQRKKLGDTTVIAGTRRKDGTFRKAIRIRPGFKSEELSIKEPYNEKASIEVAKKE